MSQRNNKKPVSSQSVRKPAPEKPVLVKEEPKVRSTTTVLLPDTSKLTVAEIDDYFSNYEDFFDSKHKIVRDKATNVEKKFAFISFSNGIIIYNFILTFFISIRKLLLQKYIMMSWKNLFSLLSFFDSFFSLFLRFTFQFLLLML